MNNNCRMRSLRPINQVRALPTTQVPPLDGDVCGVCLDGDVAKVHIVGFRV
jgi:hypothetical protein